jgi:hypothetical protein
VGSEPRVRIGYAFGTRTRLNDDGFATVVDGLERLGFTVSLSERIGGDTRPTPWMAFAAGRTTKLKFGMSAMVLRSQSIVLAELATPTVVEWRLLPAFGLAPTRDNRHSGRTWRTSEVVRPCVLRGVGGGQPTHGDHFNTIIGCRRSLQEHLTPGWWIAPSDCAAPGSLIWRPAS